MVEFPHSTVGFHLDEDIRSAISAKIRVWRIAQENAKGPPGHPWLIYLCGGLADNAFLSYERNMEGPINPAEYRGFQKAYDFSNAELFGGSLPHVLVTLRRHGKARGYFLRIGSVGARRTRKYTNWP